MVLAGKPAIGLLYVVGRCRSRKPENLVEITDGVKSGDRVVTKNAFLVKSQAMKSELGEE